MSKLPNEVLNKISEILKNGNPNTIEKILDECKKINHIVQRKSSSDMSTNNTSDKTSLIEE